MTTFVMATRGLLIQAIAACMCQAILSAVFPLVLWFYIYKDIDSLYYLAYGEWGASGLAFCLGIVGIVSESYTLIGLHTVLAPAIGAAICAIHTGVYLLVNSRCSMAQNAFMGCATCACSITNSCTKALISSVPGCGSCQTPTIELCNNMMSNYGLLFLCMGFGSAVAVAAPAAVSSQLLARLEGERASTSNRLHYACNVVSRELKRVGDQKEVSLSRPFIKELVSTILAFGNEGDRSQAIQLCAAAHFDITKLIDDTLTSTLAESTFAEESRETAHRLPAGRAALAPHDDVMGGGRMDVRRSVDLPPPGSRLQSPATRQVPSLALDALHDHDERQGHTDLHNGMDPHSGLEDGQFMASPSRLGGKSRSKGKSGRKKVAPDGGEEVSLPGSPSMPRPESNFLTAGQ